ncbi:MAG: PP2C family protein-serine/threonine phosphatase [Anaerolineae bacterium]
MEIQAAVAKIGKYATRESGDTVEMIERPHGGISLVMADGQRSGRSAKAISNVVARKAISLLAEGVRDGAAARATQDYLYTYRRGKVQATLNIVTVDLETRSIVLSRNSHCPVVVATPDGIQVLDEPSKPVGVYRGTKPVITELSIQPGTYVVAFTDGIATAGERSPDGPLDVPKFVARFLGIGTQHALGMREPEVAGDAINVEQDQVDAQALADSILNRALARDDGRPHDDMTVVVLAVLPRTVDDDVRHLMLRYPI